MKQNPEKTVVIGGGFSGLTASAFLAKEGYEVTLLEKLDEVGGRARNFTTQGYTFDMGPSWYWMPDIFEKLFQSFGKEPRDYYDLELLEPSFKMFFNKGDYVDVPSRKEDFIAWAEMREKGAGKKLKQFLEEAEFKYEYATQNLLYNPSESIWDLLSLDLLKKLPRLNMFKSLRSVVRKNFEDHQIRSLLEFPVIFLGGTAKDIPALYSLMDHAAFTQGTWYPKDGFAGVAQGLNKLAEDQGVNIKTNTTIQSIFPKEGKNILETSEGTYKADGVIGSADYAHIESLMDAKHRNYKGKFWQKQQMAPSSLIFYAGVKKKIPGLAHHNLFFDKDFESHTNKIFENPEWPDEPLFYVCCTSKTDSSTAPEGHENLFILVPLAPGLEDTQSLHDKYFNHILSRMENILEISLLSDTQLFRSYGIRDFEKDYNSFKGNAYGHANTLFQTASFKPAIRNKQLNNFFYAGQLTVPGPGVPPTLISGEIAAKQLIKNLSKQP